MKSDEQTRNTTRTDLSWSAIGYAIYMLSQIGIVMVMSRLASVEDIGRYGLSISLATIIITFCNLGLRVGHATDVAVDDRMNIYVATRSLTTLFAFCVLAFIAILGMDTQTAHIMLLVALAKSAEAISDLCYGSFQKARQLQHLAMSMLLRGPISLVIFFLLLASTGNLGIALLAQAVTWWSVALAHDFRRANRIEPSLPRFDFPRILLLVRETIPLGIAGLFTAIATNAPRIIVSYTLGLTLAGIYTTVGFVLQVGTVFATSISHAIANRLAKNFHDGRLRAYTLLVSKFAGAMAILGAFALIISILFGREILDIAFGAFYADYTLLFGLLVTALMVRLPIATLQTALVAQRRFRSFAVLRVFVAAGIVVGSWIGAVMLGLTGVAVAIITVSIIQLAFVALMLAQGIRAAKATSSETS